MDNYYILTVSQTKRDAKTGKETSYYRVVSGRVSQEEANNAGFTIGNGSGSFGCNEATYQGYLAAGLIEQ